MYLLLCFVVSLSSICVINAIQCGLPGRPAYGRVIQEGHSYNEGESVTYTCNSGYYMIGTIVRRCLPNGTWTGNIPVCDTTLSSLSHYTSSSESLSQYPPDLANDGNKKTCFYSNRRKPRWWRMDMGFTQTVLSVSITVPFASSEHHFTIYVIEVKDSVTKYHKCASFRGIFSSQAMILGCGNIKGITGSLLHIEDNSHNLEYFGLCEVEVFVLKDYYECGQPEEPANSYTHDTPGHTVTYDCHPGYRLDGSKIRTCMKSGQWTESQPICRPIHCSRPLAVENGHFRIVGQANNEIPALGSKIFYSCAPGYSLVGGNDTQYCEENGTWTGQQPECHPVDCGLPNDNSDYLGGRFKLLNGSTRFTSMAELMCFNGKRLSLIIRCADDGSWTGLESTCIYDRVNFYTATLSDKMVDKKSDISISIILSSVIVVVLLILLILITLLFKRNILQLKWSTRPPSLNCSGRTSWAIEALRSTNIPFRKPFRVQANSSVKSQAIVGATTQSSAKSMSNKLENVYEEIANFSSNPITEETEEKIRRAALIAAELAVINEKKQSQQNTCPLTQPSTSAQKQPPIGLYAKIDLIQKHKDRLLREQKYLKDFGHYSTISETNDTIAYNSCNSGSSNSSNSNNSNNAGVVNDNGPVDTIAGHPKLQQTISNSEVLGFSHIPVMTNHLETIRVSSLDLSNTHHLLKDNMIFVGHPALTNTLTRMTTTTTTGSNPDVTHIYTINP